MKKNVFGQSMEKLVNLLRRFSWRNFLSSIPAEFYLFALVVLFAIISGKFDELGKRHDDVMINNLVNHDEVARKVAAKLKNGKTPADFNDEELRRYLDERGLYIVIEERVKEARFVKMLGEEISKKVIEKLESGKAAPAFTIEELQHYRENYEFYAEVMCREAEKIKKMANGVSDH